MFILLIVFILAWFFPPLWFLFFGILIWEFITRRANAHIFGFVNGMINQGVEEVVFTKRFYWESVRNTLLRNGGQHLNKYDTDYVYLDGYEYKGKVYCIFTGNVPILNEVMFSIAPVSSHNTGSLLDFYYEESLKKTENTAKVEEKDSELSDYLICDIDQVLEEICDDLIETGDVFLVKENIPVWFYDVLFSLGDNAECKHLIKVAIKTNKQVITFYKGYNGYHFRVSFIRNGVVGRDDATVSIKIKKI